MELLKEFLDCPAPSGREEKLTGLIAEKLKPFGFVTERDALGSLICHKKGAGKRTLFAAQTDEAALMVNFIEDSGLLRFCPVGDIAPRALFNCRADFINGVRGAVLFDKQADLSKLDVKDLFIDIGAKGKADAEKAVSPGDLAVLRGEIFSREDRIFAPALSARAGCAALIEAAMRAENAKNDLYLAFVTQKRLGFRGAKTAAFKAAPDIAVSVGVSSVSDFSKGGRESAALGKGAVLTLKDASYVAHERAADYIQRCAHTAGRALQREVSVYKEDDCGAIFLGGSDAPAGALNIPVKIGASLYETACPADIEDVAEILKTMMETEV